MKKTLLLALTSLTLTTYADYTDKYYNYLRATMPEFAAAHDRVVRETAYIYDDIEERVNRFTEEQSHLVDSQIKSIREESVNLYNTSTIKIQLDLLPNDLVSKNQANKQYSLGDNLKSVINRIAVVLTEGYTVTEIATHLNDETIDLINQLVSYNDNVPESFSQEDSYTLKVISNHDWVALSKKGEI